MADRVVWCNRFWLPLYFGFCPSEAAWNHEMKRLGQPHVVYPAAHKDANTTFMENTKERRSIAIVTVHERFKSRLRRGEADTIALVVHEAVHVWQEALSHVGEGKASAELEAYGVQCIFTGLYHACLTTWFPKHKGIG